MERKKRAGPAPEGPAAAKRPKAAISQVMEDYLKAIYHLHPGRGEVNPKEIAREMGVSPPSVTSMLRKLAGLRLIRYAPYRRVRLEPAGERVALEVIRHHRLLELFLQEVLGYRLDGVHAEADRLEHSLSEELEERIDQVLGGPRLDPHGSPIPGRDGSILERSLAPLSAAETGRAVTVGQLLSRDAAHLRYLESIGLLPGARVRVLERGPLGGPVSIGIGAGRREVIGRELADRILVLPPEAGEEEA